MHSLNFLHILKNNLKGDCLFMKMTIIKKLLAAILTAATIMAAPGFASAVPDPNKKNGKNMEKLLGHNVGHDNQDGEDEEMEMDDGQGDEMDDGQGDDQVFAVFVYNGIDNVPIQSDNEKIGFAVRVTMSAVMNLLWGYTPEQTSHLLDRLAQCATADVAKLYVAEAIKNLVYYGVLCGLEQIEHAVDILINCATANSAKGYVAEVIAELLNEGSLDEYTPEQIGHIVNTLINCATVNDAKEYVAKATTELASKGLISEAQKQQLAQAIA